MGILKRVKRYLNKYRIYYINRKDARGIIDTKVIQNAFCSDRAKIYSTKLHRYSCFSDLRAIMCSFSDMVRLGWKRKDLRFVAYRPWLLEFAEMDDGEELDIFLKSSISCISDGQTKFKSFDRDIYYMDLGCHCP